MIRQMTAPSRTLLPRSLRLLILCAAALSMVLSVQIASAFAEEPITWSASPATAEGSDGRVSLRHELDPGASVSDFIAVTNDSAVDTTFTVASGDGVMGDNGAFDVSTDAPSDAGAWFVIDGLDGDQLTLAAGETRVLPLTITVPADATPGDHPAGVVVALVSKAEGISVTHRVGVRAHLRVTGEITAALESEIVSTSYQPSVVPFAPGVLRVQATVVNTGNVRLGTDAVLSSTGLFGLGATSGRLDQPVELLPGDRATVTLETKAVPTIVGLGEMHLIPTIIGQDSAPLPSGHIDAVWFFAPNWSGFGIVAVGAGVVWLFVRMNRRLRKAEAAIAAAVGNPTAETAPHHPGTQE